MARVVFALLALLAACAASPPAPARWPCREYQARLAVGRAEPALTDLDEVAGLPITRVDVAGDSTGRIREAIHARPPAALSRGLIADDVRRIWRLEIVEDVEVEAAREGRGVALTYRVVERPLIGRVRLESGGAWVPGRRGLERLAGGIYDPARLARVAERLRGDWVQAGHLRAQVQVGVRRGGDGRVDVCLDGRPGPRFVVERVALVGNRRIADGELLARIRTEAGRVNTPGGLYRADLLAEDVYSLTALYYDRGMVQASVASPEVEVDAARATLRVSLRVHEGPVYHLGRVEVRGLGVTPGELGLASGEVFNRAKVSQAMLRLRDLAHREVQPATEIDEDGRRIHLVLEVEAP
jgi:outer membrane protein insertion porin family